MILRDKYLAQVQARDSFGADGRAKAEAEVEQCAGVLEEFDYEIYQHQDTLGNGAH